MQSNKIDKSKSELLHHCRSYRDVCFNLLLLNALKIKCDVNTSSLCGKSMYSHTLKMN